MTEEILAPDLAIIDPHHHLWDLRPVLAAFPEPRHDFLETLAGAPAVLSSLRDVHGERLTLQEAVAFARRGDAGCTRAIADAGSAIGTAVATLCNLLNPQRVVVGGDLGAAGELLLQPLREALRRGAIRSAADDVEVVGGELGERAEVLGAVALVLSRGDFARAKA